MGKVYLARHQYLNVHHAIKVLPASLAGNEVFVRRFLREAAHAARLNHPNVVRTLAADEYRGVYYMAMEFVPGQTLQEVCDLETVAAPLAVFYTHQLAQALDHAHQHGIVHRDVKPDNVVISLEGDARLMDFGLGREIESAQADQLTAAGVAVGTPHYMPPEQWRNEGIDHRSDIYALGITLFHVLSLRFPFDGDSTDEVRAAQDAGKPHRLDWIVPDLDKHLCDIVGSMIALRPDDRPQSAMEVCRLLEDWWAKTRPDEDPLAKTVSVPTVSPHDRLPPIHLRDTRVITPSEQDPAGSTRAPSAFADTEELWPGGVCIRHPRDGLRADNTYCAQYRSADRKLQTACVFGIAFLSSDSARATLRRQLRGFTNLSAVLLAESGASTRAVQDLATFMRDHAPDAVVVCSSEARHLLDLPPSLEDRIIATNRVINGLDLPTGQRLLPLAAPFASHPGSVAYYDPEHATLFTGALMSGFVHPANNAVYAERKDWYGLKAFHQLFMPAADALLRALTWMDDLDPPVACVAPATGLIVRGDVLKQFIESLREAAVGLAEVDRQIRSAARLDEHTELLRYTLQQLLTTHNLDIREQLEADRDLRRIIDWSGAEPAVMGVGAEAIEMVLTIAAAQLDRTDEMKLRFETYMESERLRVAYPRLLLP